MMYTLLVSQKPVCRVTRHLVLFASMILLFTWIAASRADSGTPLTDVMLMVTTNAVFFFGYAYLAVYLLIPLFLVTRKYMLFILLFMAAGLVLSLLKFAFSDFVFYQAIAPENGPGTGSLSFGNLLVNTKDMTFIVALFALAKFARDRYLLTRQIHEIRRRGLEAELKLLEHHMDPHVIFNNFNSLYSISINKPELLKPNVRKLKSLLHYLFDESKKELVPLSREVEMIDNYIGLEKLRYGDRLKVTFSREGPLEGLRIAPLILYSFVENCFVHGAGTETSGSWINLELKVSDTRLSFVADNSVSEHGRLNRSRKKGGTGENSLRRLELQYPNRHRVAIFEKKNNHRIELSVSL